MHQFLKFIFGIELYMFRTGFLSIIRSLVLYTQQWVYVIQVTVTACWWDQDVGFTLSQATKALRESRGIALLYFRPLH